MDRTISPLRKAAIGGLLVGTTLVGGAVGASLVGSAGAETNPTSDTTATTATDGSSDATAATPPDHDPSQGGHEANGITETLLTGDDADQATAAALEAVPGGTVERVETDAEGDAYEAHMTDADGNQVTVKLDESFGLVTVEQGR